MFLLNNKKFNPYSFFEVDGVQYPLNWFQSASPEEKAALGITEVPDPVRPDDKFFYVQENDDGTFTTVPKDLNPIKEQYKNDVDITCGNIREAVVSKGLFITEEYRVAYEDALAFRAAGYTGVVPASVQTWADVSENTAQWAADDVITTRDGYVNMMNTIRDVRLKSKAAIDAATTPEELMQAVANFHNSVAVVET